MWEALILRLSGSNILGTQQAALPAGYKLVTVFCIIFRYSIR